MIKVLTLALVLAGAEVEDLYPESADPDRYPVAHWQLTMVSQTDMVDIDADGFQFFTRKSCVRDGMRRMQESLDVEIPPEAGVWLGFVCEYVTE
jgi:hypothetical protein